MKVTCSGFVHLEPAALDRHLKPAPGCDRGTGWRPIVMMANQTTSFFLVSRFDSGVYSAKLLNGTTQRF